MAAHILHSKYDSRELTRAGRDKFMARLRIKSTLIECCQRRNDFGAEHAWKAYFAGLALKSARARRKNK